MRSITKAEYDAHVNARTAAAKIRQPELADKIEAARLAALTETGPFQAIDNPDGTIRTIVIGA